MPLGRPVEPDEYIQNAMSSGPVSAAASSSGSHVDECRLGCCARGRIGAVHDDDPLDLRALQHVRTEARRERRLAYGQRRVRIHQEVVQQLRAGLDVQQDRHESGPHGAEERRGVGRRVVQKERDARPGGEPRALLNALPHFAALAYRARGRSARRTVRLPPACPGFGRGCPTGRRSSSGGARDRIRSRSSPARPGRPDRSPRPLRLTFSAS